MKKSTIGILFGFIFFSANTFAFTQTESNTEIKSDIAKELTQRYNNTVADCGNSQSPALLCSGILMRGTVNAPPYKFWGLNPASIKNNGVSFSYLRKDAKLSHLFRTFHGFIIFPNNMIPKDTVQIPVLCSYPIDANTWNRGSSVGNYCGVPVGAANPDKNKSCQDFGILTAEKLTNSFNVRGPAAVCAMDIRSTAKNPAEAFLSTLAVMRSRLGLPYNEIVLQPWDQENPQTLPIEALFSVNGLELNMAKRDQIDYKNATGKFIPIVNIKLPSNAKEDAVFTFNPKDQAVNP